MQNLIGGLGGLFGGVMGLNTAHNVNGQVGGAIGQNLGASSSLIAQLQQQQAQQRQQAQDMYQRSLGDVTGQNGQLQGNIDTLTGSLNALSDPNSPYMQMARQAIERKDAAAGRNSQWGDREVQLAGTLADYVGKYSPSLNNSITAARNQINVNNQGLASLYNTANSPASSSVQQMIAALTGQLAGANAANSTGRAAANSQTNNLMSLINSGIKGAGGLAGLFGSGGGSGITSGWGGAGLGTGLWGDSNLYGNGWTLGSGQTGGGMGGGYLGLGGLDSGGFNTGNGLNPWATSGLDNTNNYGDYGDY